MAVLEVRGLRVSFKIDKKWVPAVEDVSFSVDAGETLGIVGESGCGKSVTSMSILHLLPEKTSRIEQGQVLYKGTDLVPLDNRAMSAYRGQEISMIFQDSMTSLNPVLTVGRQIAEACRLHTSLSEGEAWQAALELLRRVEIPSPEKRMKEYPHQLSGGMRQRVMIAIALARNPSVMIADEPTTALDVTIQAQILELMKELKRQSNTAILLITHDMGVVAEMSDRIMVMYAGMVMELGTAHDIFKDPKHPYTRGLLAAIPRKDKDVDELYTIEGTVPTLQTMPKGCRFCTRCKEAQPRCFEERPPEGCVCIDDDLVVYRGVRILGLGGSYRYRPGAYTFTERQMRLRIRKLWFKLWRRKGFDILLTHAPLRGHNDMDNLSHRGFACFGPLLDKYQPKYFIHGHIHMSYGHDVPRLSRHGDTTVVNAYEYYKLELEPNGAEVRPAGA